MGNFGVGKPCNLHLENVFLFKVRSSLFKDRNVVDIYKNCVFTETEEEIWNELKKIKPWGSQHLVSYYVQMSGRKKMEGRKVKCVVQDMAESYCQSVLEFKQRTKRDERSRAANRLTRRLYGANLFLFHPFLVSRSFYHVPLILFRYMFFFCFHSPRANPGRME